MRALLLVLDSVGIGGAPDAASYSDEGANTLGHILESAPDERSRAQSEIDRRVGGQWCHGSFLHRIEPDDLVIITADHGNDPTYHGTDHTREQVPLFVLHNQESRRLGVRKTYADIAATLADYFELSAEWPVGESFVGRNFSGKAMKMKASN